MNRSPKITQTVQRAGESHPVSALAALLGQKKAEQAAATAAARVETVCELFYREHSEFIQENPGWDLQHWRETVPDYPFDAKRRWELDVVLRWGARHASGEEWEFQVGVELEGGIYTGGRHTRARGYTNDCEKYNQALIAGYPVLRFTTDHFQDPGYQYIRSTIRKAMEARLIA